MDRMHIIKIENIVLWLYTSEICLYFSPLDFNRFLINVEYPIESYYSAY